MHEPPIVAVTFLGDTTADLVLAELHGRGVPVVRLDPGIDFPADARMSAHLTARGLSGTIHTPTRQIELDAVRSVYWRRPTPYGGTGPGVTVEEQFTNSQSRAGYAGVLAHLPGALYVNHPWRNRDAEYKNAQLAAASCVDMYVPESLITTDPDDARRFIEEHGPAVYKPLRLVHLPGDDGKGRTVWVHVVDADEVDERVSLCPHFFQSCVDKVADIRLAAVGDELFATRIDIDGDHLDWREDYHRLSYTPVPVPATVRTAVRAFLDAFGLTFGAFDFALDADGRWWFLECNPNGQWAFVDDPTRRAITEALADTLQKGRT
ncbi:ATP-grasp ribosomal peptide maturase [Streptomyces sp. NPDC102406]|uniref:ATP-grasp ribosomal peptide maturase n=1 Tax=Streptomyces sp. NPDC102406 TaxID=3366171 RepID=UPI0038033A8F